MTATYGVISNTTYASRTNTTITAPASIGNGDLLLLAHITAASGTAPTQTLPAGFTQIGTTQTGSDGSFGYSFKMAYKIAASEAGDYTVTHTVASSMGLIVRVDGTGTLSVDVSSAANSVSSGTTATATAVTPTATDDLLFYIGLNWNTGALTPPAGMTERLDALLLYVASEALVSGSATGTRVLNLGGTAVPWFADLVAIKDASLGALAVTGAQTTSAVTQSAVASTGSAVFDFTSGVLDPRITFSRASLGTYYGSDGLLKYAAHNFFIQSQTFQTSWTLGNGGTVTADAATAPDGTTTADRLNHVTAGTVSGGQVFQNFATPLYRGIVSCYVKAGSKNLVMFNHNANATANCWFNLATGVAGTFSATHWIATGMSDAGGGWWRCWGLMPNTMTGASIRVAETDNVTTCTSPGDIYIWGAQVEHVTTATTPGAYIPTTTAAVHGPRLDYDPVTHVAKGLLIEEARTSNLANSQDFTAAGWTKTGATVTGDNTTAPDGTTTADLITASATPATVAEFSAINIGAGVSYVLSVFVKKGTSDWVYLCGEITATGPETPKAWFNINTGTVGTIEANITSATIQNVGNGWYRCVITRLATAGTERFMIGICDADNSATVTVGRTVYLWGAGNETTATFPTSYIPTTSGAVTRAADVAVMTGTDFSSWYSASAGTFIAGFELMTQTGTRPVLSVDNATVNERILLYGSGTDPKVTITDNSVTQADLDLGTL